MSNKLYYRYIIYPISIMFIYPYNWDMEDRCISSKEIKKKSQVCE